MAKYICTVCGFVYDEAKGIPDAGIAAGTRWEDLPEDWVCPLCGATKSEFEKQGESDMTPKKEPISVIESPVDMKEMSPLEVSALCTNLARGVKNSTSPKKQLYLMNWLVILNRYQHRPKTRISVSYLTLLKRTLSRDSQMPMPWQLMQRIGVRSVLLSGARR